MVFCTFTGGYVRSPTFAKDVTGKPSTVPQQMSCRAWGKVQGSHALKTDALGALRMDSQQFPGGFPIGSIEIIDCSKSRSSVTVMICHTTWWFIPLSKQVISGISLVIVKWDK